MKNFKKYLLFIFGLIIFGFGISLGNKSLFGGNPMSIFVVGLSKHISFSIGTCNLIVAIFEMIIGYLTDKKNVTIATLIGVVCGSYAIDLGNLIIPDCSAIYLRIIYMLIGCLLYCLGLALQQASKCGYGNLDCFIFGLGKLFKIKDYYKIRWIVDILFIGFGYILGGIVGLGTLIILLFAGIMITKFRKFIEKKEPNY